VSAQGVAATAAAATLPAHDGAPTSDGRRPPGWRRIAWTLALGLASGLLFLVSHGLRVIPPVIDNPALLGGVLREAAVTLGASVLVALLLMLALTVVERRSRDGSPGWLAYAVATLAATAAATWLVDSLSRFVPVRGIVGWYGIETRSGIDSFIFINWLLFGGLATIVYVRFCRARARQAAFARAELERAADDAEIARARLAASQAQVDPDLLFDALRQIEAAFGRDRSAGEQRIDDLIAYLRAALPRLRGEESTLAREVALAEAYVRIAVSRRQGAVALTTDIPPSLAGRRFPPMLVVPLIESRIGDAVAYPVHGGHLEIRADADAVALRVTIADDGTPGWPANASSAAAATLGERLAAVCGERAALTLTAREPRGAQATIEVPFA
jgi:hypothetical protein